uniref:Uncharacterized protein n=1 Tax=Stauridium tetras TaxID=271398 RepID=A0A2U8GMN4_9CHLO|nr:hypothetical protein [Stauridium tetras]AWI68980.1 hypothetical protein [Stauridium tetras]
MKMKPITRSLISRSAKETAGDTDPDKNTKNAIAEQKSESIIQQDTIDIDKELELELAEYDPNIIKKSESSKTINKEQVQQIIVRLQTYKNIGRKATVQAIAALFRKGAANARAADTMKVDVYCPETDTSIEITRYDMVMAIQSITGHKNIRKLAEAMAPEMISANLKIIQKNPLVDLKGDLANRISRKLSLRKEDPLTRAEEVCCCTYSQWMPNLNELANSKRLKSLLEEDLNARKKRQSKKSEKKQEKKVVKE